MLHNGGIIGLIFWFLQVFGGMQNLLKMRVNRSVSSTFWLVWANHLVFKNGWFVIVTSVAPHHGRCCIYTDRTRYCYHSLEGLSGKKDKDVDHGAKRCKVLAVS